MAQVVLAAAAAAKWYAGLSGLAQVGIQLGASVALTSASLAFQETPRAPNVKRELGRPNSLPRRKTP